VEALRRGEQQGAWLGIGVKVRSGLGFGVRARVRVRVRAKFRARVRTVVREQQAAVGTARHAPLARGPRHRLH